MLIHYTKVSFGIACCLWCICCTWRSFEILAVISNTFSDCAYNSVVNFCFDISVDSWDRTRKLLNVSFVRCTGRHNIACFKATEGLQTSPSPYRAAGSHQYSVARFATLQLLSCLHSPGLRCLCCKLVRFCCALETWNFVTAVYNHWIISRSKPEIEPSPEIFRIFVLIYLR
jgi:hypothetical protein